MQTAQIKGKYDLPNLAHRYGVKLRRSGRGFTGCCPFHDDRNPSFSIYFSPGGGWSFKCFAGSCGLSGDVIDFIGLMRFGKMWDAQDPDKFKAALGLLGEKDMGLSEKRWETEPSEKDYSYHTITSNVRFVWDIALSVYSDRLVNTPKAMSYLVDTRKLPHEVVRKYRFGYCPPDNSSLRYSMYALNKSDDDLEYAGIFRPSKRIGDMNYEFFYGRITFADVDYHRRPLYVFGRSLPDSSANSKYLGLANFPKPVFGLETISSTGTVFLMEGPINAMICRHWGFDAIALTGTSPSQMHIEAITEIIVRKRRRLVPVVDNDQAGTVAVAQWQERIPKIETPLRLPPEVDGVPIKDINDLHTATSRGKELFYQLAHQNKLL